MNVPADDASNLLGALSLLIEGTVRAAVTAEAGAAGALPEALVVVKDQPGATAEWLGQVLGLSQPGTAHLVRRLVQSGWIERRPGSDARSYRLHLTAAGLRIAEQVLRARRQVLTELLTPLSAEQRRQLTDIATALLRPQPADERCLARLCRLCDRSACPECPVYAGYTDRGPDNSG
ncbi:MarR family winged helix-turn-helix transcriptional regulator [Plantactinospora sp. CA-294935]|uniref:MarR family winged helix-turn-helix transcriptional regulator n=1 Tax=Plantactinospora sp. CA-294935 TaxID=3240012 RepID=UPI003D91EE63